MTTDDSPFDERYEALLVELHEAVISGDVSTRGSSEVVAATQTDDTGLVERLEGAEACLRLLERMRRDFDGEDDSAISTPQCIGRFQISRLLGHGTYGVVYQAYDPKLQRDVAVKIARPEVVLSRPLRERFLREAEAAAALAHPHIVPIFEAGQADGMFYTVMAYCAGSTLSQWLHEQPELPEPAAAARLVATLADAVAHAHSRGILHRDLKPSNVLMTRDVESREVSPCITDFGLAKFLGDDSSQTASSAIVGTPSYMAPEQASGKNSEIGTATDVYALGTILFELLTGRAAFAEQTVGATLDAVRNRPAQPPGRLRPDVPRDLNAICLKCLEKSPANRYRSAAELSDDLAHFLNHEPISARPIRNAERFARWCRRNPVLSGLSAAIVVLLLVLAMGSTVAALLLANANRKTLDSLDAEIRAKDAATKSEELAIAALYEARVAQARLQRESGEIGHRLQSLDALAKAAAHIPRLKYGENERRQLRNEAIACMTLVDLELEKEWPYSWTPSFRATKDADMNHYAANVNRNTIVVRRMSDNKELARVAGSGPDVLYRKIRLSPNARFLAAVAQIDRVIKLQVWRLSDSAMVHVSPVPTWKTSAFDFSPDGCLLAVARRGGAVELLSTDSFEPDRVIPGRQTGTIVRFAPDGSRLAIVRQSRVEIVDAATGKVRCSIEHGANIFILAWSGDGTLLATTSLKQPVRLWDTRTGAMRGVIGSRLPAQITSAAFHPNGRLLNTSGRDGKTRLWDVATGRQLLVGSDFFGFSRNGKWSGKPVGRYRVVQSVEHRVLHSPLAAAGETNRPERISIHPRERILAASKEQLVLWDLDAMRPIASTRLRGFAQFDPTGEYLVVKTGGGLFRLPVHFKEADDGIVCQIGPPEQLASSGALGYLAVSRNGKTIAWADRYRRYRVEVFDAQKRTMVPLAEQHRGAKWLDMTTDGRLLATSTWHGADAKIWDLKSGTLVQTIPCASARVRFSPDGTMLVVDEGARYSIWDTETWRRLFQPVVRKHRSVPPPIAFSPDGRLLALAAGPGAITLLDTADCHEIAKFPVGAALDSLAFSPDGSRLVASSGQDASIDVWDLRRVRRQLKAMNLDWNHPPPALPDSTTPKKLVVELDMGDLAASGPSVPRPRPAGTKSALSD